MNTTTFAVSFVSFSLFFSSLYLVMGFLLRFQMKQQDSIPSHGSDPAVTSYTFL